MTEESEGETLIFYATGSEKYICQKILSDKPFYKMFVKSNKNNLLNNYKTIIN